jgi:hypothetical protein
VSALSVLASFAFAKDLRPIPPGGHLMLDSGGYSAWAKGIEVTVAGLSGWYAGIPAEVYAALDVIYDPEASRANALAMRDRLGFEVTPAVHAGTPPAAVDQLADDGFTTLALGGLVNKHNARQHADAWAHACLDRADARGMRVHGFGLSPSNPARLPLVMRFASVDSSTWLAARYGRDTRLWDGRAYVSLDMNRDRLVMASIMRRWPGDWTPALTRHRGGGNSPASLRQLQLAGAASMLAFGEWLMARGGPRVYLASYLSNIAAADDQTILDLLAAIAPEPLEASA